MNEFIEYYQNKLNLLKSEGLYKDEREITSPQGSHIELRGPKKVLNFCANNYLGLANHPEVLAAAKNHLKEEGFGLASVRFICGTQNLHHHLEKKLSAFLETEATILYSSCFDANGGLFECLFDKDDAIISDELNHASIIDGIRLSKANRYRYKNNDMHDLEAKLQEAKGARFRVIATDAVFSMDGIIANLAKIVELADRYQALVMVDDCHGVGVLGERGKGTLEFCNVLGKVDLITGTLGKALGGGSGGYVSGKKEIIEWLRQRSRPYLFSNTLAPCMAGGALKAIEIVENDPDLRAGLLEKTTYFRTKMMEAGFNIIPGIHPIIPVIFGDAKVAQNFAAKLLDHRIFVVPFSYPVVPEGKARIRIQISAAHSKEDLDYALDAFKTVGST